MRDEQKLLQLRPELQLPTLPSGVEEQFQNQTLRPILKMQHPLLARLMLTQIQRYKGTFFQLSKPNRLEWIANTIRDDARLRHLLAGTIIGHFTMDELKIFEANEAQYMRRLMQMMVQRLQSVDFDAMA
ncbi:MAG: glyoxalase [Saprospiraceae bacterium]